MKRVHVIGSYHADMAWKKGAGEMEELWESFILRLVDLLETYPDFTYVLEQAAHFRQMAIDRPDLVRRISKFVKDGRVEVMGGMATTMDTNMPCGESIVRNMLLGMDWFRQNMGVEVKTGWLIDTFGINAQMPQLLNQAGIRHLMANRFGNEMTRDLFIAIGLDGSRLTVAGREVFGSSIPDARVLFGFTQIWKHTDNLFNLAAEASGDGPYLLMPYVENEYLPSKRIDMDLKTLKSRDDGEYFYSLPHRFFKELDAWKKLPEVSSDLNPEFTGTYSQRMPIRLMNRRVESLLLDAEKWACLLSQAQSNMKGEIDQAWWKLAFNHFHDVFTGSHPTEVFNYVVDNFLSAEHAAEHIFESTFNCSYAKDIQPGIVSVLNSLPRDRREIVSVPLQGIRSKGVEVSCKGVKKLCEEHNGFLLFEADMPATGMSEYSLKEMETASSVVFQPISQGLIENEYICISASRENGIEAVILKPDHVLIQNAGALLTAQQDNGSFQIEDPCGGEVPVMASGANLFKAESALGQRLLLKGSMKELSWASKEDMLTWSLELFLPQGLQRVDVTFQIGWQASGVRLRVKLPTDINSSSGIFEIPFGAITRKSYMPGASKKGEWPAQRFVAVEDGNFGVALVNTGVPGVEISGGTIWSTLLRAPISEYAGMYPDDTSSQHGQHTFSFAIVPYQGAWQDSHVLEYADSLNSPARVLVGSLSRLAAGDSLAKLEGGTASLSVIKLPQDIAPGEIIVRLYESGGRESYSSLYVRGAKTAWNSNIIEEKGEGISCTDGNITIRLKPYEIKTFRIGLSRE